jgi:HSP90 family molecular chaperone
LHVPADDTPGDSDPTMEDKPRSSNLSALASAHRELVERGAEDAHVRTLLSDSAAIVLTRMHQLTRELRRLERECAEQELLDQQRASRTIELFAARLTELEPKLAVLRARQDAIVAELVTLVDQARER